MVACIKHDIGDNDLDDLDCHLECELHAGLGEHCEAAQDPGPGDVLKLCEVLLAPDDGDQVPGHQRHREQQGTEKHRPGNMLDDPY